MGKLELGKLGLATILTGIIVFSIAKLTQIIPITLIDFIITVIGFSVLLFLSIVAVKKFLVKGSNSLAVFIGAFIGSNIQFITTILLSGASLAEPINLQLQFGALFNGLILLGVLALIDAIAKKLFN